MSRAGFPSARSLNDVITATPQGAHRTFLEREASLTIDGRPLRHEPYLLYSANPREQRGARQFLEVLTLARGLAFLKHENAVATRATHPDFEVQLQDGGRVGVEVTDAFATGIYEGRLQELRLALLDGVHASGHPLHGRLVTLSAKRAWESGIAVNLGVEPVVPIEAFPFKNRDVDEFVTEFVAWIGAGEHRKDRSGADAFNDPGYPAMTRWQIVITSSQMTDSNHAGVVEFMLPNVGRSVDQLKATVSEALARKQAKAANYGLTRPLWLFIELADRAVRSARAFEEFVRDGLPPIAPYELVVVIHDGIAISIDRRGAVARMDLESASRSLPFAPM